MIVRAPVGSMSRTTEEVWAGQHLYAFDVDSDPGSAGKP
ncbi:hypothetical protein HD597_012330 [Nonomuraea thailandensis]|uniref:Uncharacterized protein n=1 Tax=Nonomuraea thailandensis TaxID=1188745 RepID=A0A9X2GWN7_9ACTN|nr:hypothetical protein [Nonomuraea thailandensis]